VLAPHSHTHTGPASRRLFAHDNRAALDATAATPVAMRLPARGPSTRTACLGCANSPSRKGLQASAAHSASSSSMRSRTSESAPPTSRARSAESRSESMAVWVRAQQLLLRAAFSLFNRALFISNRHCASGANFGKANLAEPFCRASDGAYPEFGLSQHFR
jgi:hypothetical protein